MLRMIIYKRGWGGGTETNDKHRSKRDPGMMLMSFDYSLRKINIGTLFKMLLSLKYQNFLLHIFISCRYKL